MKTRRLTVVLLLTVLTGGVLAQQSPAPEMLLKAAMQRELVDGDLTGAIDQYNAIVSKYGDNHAVAAKALLQIGQCYEKLGKPEARDAYDRVVRLYPDSGASFTTARARLATFQAATAGPFKNRSLDAMIKTDYKVVRVSPSGASVAYLRPVSGKGDVLCVRDFATGSKERVLVEPKDKNERIANRDLDWSPDNARLSYSMMTADAEELRVVTVARGESRTYATVETTPTAITAFRWSPDGQKLAFTITTIKRAQADPVDVRLMSVGSTEVQRLGTVTVIRPSWVWSPDSQRIAWVATAAAAPATEEFRIVTIATRESRALAIPQAAKGVSTSLTAWTLKDELFFQQTVPALGNDYFLIAAGGGEARRICEGRGNSGGDGCTGLNLEGTLQIARKHVADGGRTVLRDTRTGAERPLTLASVTENPVGVGFSPNGRLFAFQSRRDGKWGLYVVPVDRIPVANPVRVADLGSEGNSVSGWWTRDGLVVRITHSQTNVYRLGVDPKSGRPTGILQRLTQSEPRNEAPMVSPDGRRIAYIARGGARSGIAVMEANGTRERFVLDVPPGPLSGVALLGWRSAEEVLLVERVPTEGRQPGVETLNIRTGELKVGQPLPMATTGRLYYIPGKQDFLIEDWEKGSASFRSTAGVEVMVLDPASSHDDQWNRVFSPDGRFLIYTAGYLPPGGKAGSNQPYINDIRLKPLDGGAERVLAHYLWDPSKNDATAWAQPTIDAVSPDGKYLLYHDFTNALRIMNVETTESWNFLGTTQGDVSFSSTAAHWSTDESFIVLTGSTTRTEWRAFDGLTYDAVTKLLKGSGK